MKFYIGEATKGIQDDIRQKYPDFPWREIAGIEINSFTFILTWIMKLVWKTIKNRIPQVKPLIRKALDDNINV